MEVPNSTLNAPKQVSPVMRIQNHETLSSDPVASLTTQRKYNKKRRVVKDQTDIPENKKNVPGVQETSLNSPDDLVENIKKLALIHRDSAKVGTVQSVEGDIDTLPETTKPSEEEGEVEEGEPVPCCDPKVNQRLAWSLRSCSTREELRNIIDAMDVCNSNFLELSVEVGTLFVKSGCKLGLGAEILDHLVQNPWIVVPLNGLNYLLVHFSVIKDFRSMGRLVSLCKKRSIVLNEESWHIMVRALVEAGRIEDAKIVLNNVVVEYKLIPERASFTVVMNALKNEGDNKAVIGLHQTMLNLHVKPSSTSVYLTVRAHFLLNDVDSGVKVIVDFLSDFSRSENVPELLCHTLINSVPVQFTLEQLCASLTKHGVAVNEDLRKRLEDVFLPTTEPCKI